MATALRTSDLERRLAESLTKDHQRRSNYRGTMADGTIIVQPSNRSIGLAIAIADRNGEDVDHILDRVGNEP